MQELTPFDELQRVKMERDELAAALMAAMNNQPLANGEYVHLLVCNANRRNPIGGDGCMCPNGQAVKTVRRLRDDALALLGKDMTLEHAGAFVEAVARLNAR